MKKWYLHVDVKADVKQQEIKGLVAESYNFLKEVSWNLEFFLHFGWIETKILFPAWYYPIKTGSEGWVRGGGFTLQNLLLNMAKVVMN